MNECKNRSLKGVYKGIQEEGKGKKRKKEGRRYIDGKMNRIYTLPWKEYIRIIKIVRKE